MTRDNTPQIIPLGNESLIDRHRWQRFADLCFQRKLPPKNYISRNVKKRKKMEPSIKVNMNYLKNLPRGTHSDQEIDTKDKTVNPVQWKNLLNQF